MADVAQPLSVFGQVRAVAALRWRILRNSLTKKNNVLDLIGLILSGIVAGILVVGLSFAFGAGAYAILSGSQPGWITLLFWGIFLFWQLFPIFAAGLGASFPFRSLLRFPMSLGAFYIIGLAYGLADFSALASICWLASMTVGATLANPQVLPAMLLIMPLFMVLNTTLERLIGSWLERLLSRRRTRELFFVLFILSMVSLNFLNPAVSHYGISLRIAVPRILSYVAWLPPSLAGRAIVASLRSDFGSFLLGSVGLLGYGAAFSVFLWRRFAAQYRGEEVSETAAPATVGTRPTVRNEDAPDRLRALSPQVAAIVRKEFRYLTRNSFAFFTLIIAPLLVLIFSAQFAGKHPAGSEHAVSPEVLFPGIMAYLVLILISPAYNCFAFEGRGIQTYFMAPLRFRDVFLGKNLMLLLVLTIEIGLSLVMLAWRLGFPSLPVLGATMACIVFAVVGQLTLANWSSLSFPRKLEFGRMRGQRQSGMAVLIAFGAQFVFGGVSAIILFSGRWMGNRWLPTEAFAVLAVASVGGYFASLDSLSRAAEAKKEGLIEALCR